MPDAPKHNCHCNGVICESCWSGLMKLIMTAKDWRKDIDRYKALMERARKEFESVVQTIRKMKHSMRDFRKPPVASALDLIANPEHPYYYAMFRKHRNWRDKLDVFNNARYVRVTFDYKFDHWFKCYSLYLIKGKQLYVPFVIVESTDKFKMVPKELIDRSLCCLQHWYGFLKFLPNPGLGGEFKAWADLIGKPYTVRNMIKFYESKLAGGL